MEITLIRHGRSTHIDHKRMDCFEFRDWVEKYNSNGIFEEETYPSGTIEKIQSVPFVVTSDLKRSIESAKLLNPNGKIKADPLFREIELPSPSTNLMGLKLKPNIWAVILRLLWFTGYSDGCESYRNAKQRANKAAIILISHAREYQSAFLVGHGFFNLLIAKELQRMGWEGKKKTGSKHWEGTTYKF